MILISYITVCTILLPNGFLQECNERISVELNYRIGIYKEGSFHYDFFADFILT
jgi:hypothetical protein